MAISLGSIKKGGDNKPPRVFLYGVEGIGKTKFGTESPAPIFIQTEDGLVSEKVQHIDRFPVAESWTDIQDAVTALTNERHEFKTVVVDTVDWLEPLIWKHVAAINRVKTIEDIEYGKGYLEAVSLWEDFLGAMDYLRGNFGMSIILLGHSDVSKFADPLRDPYDRYVPKLHKKVSPKLKEWADVVLFANYRTATKDTDVGFNKKVTRAVGSGDRVFHTLERPGFNAKNRYDMPSEIPMVEGRMWADVAQYVPYFNKPQGQPATDSTQTQTQPQQTAEVN